MFARGITIKVNFLINSKNLIKVSSLLHKLRSGMVSFEGAAIRALSSFARGMQMAAVATGRFAARVWRDLTNVEMLMNRLRAAVDGLVNAFRKSFIIVMSLYALGRGLGSFIAAAGAIEENLNAMSISFGRNKEAVLDWADGYAKATGRSRYEIREMATQFALIMKGQIDDEATVARLSTGLTERAIDMQSALQEAAGAGADVSRAIISALTGETEQIKRWGVDVRVDALKRFAKEMGKNYQNMSEAEKIEVRYQKVLKDTNHLVGDAIRTKREYTNTIKNMWGVLEDFRRVIGMGVLKPILKLTNYITDNIRELNEWLEVGSRVQAMFATVGVVIVAALTKAAVVFAPLLLRLTFLATLVSIVWVVLEDFFAWLNNENRATAFSRFAKDIGITRQDVIELASAMKQLASWTVAFVGALTKLYLLVGKPVGQFMAKQALRNQGVEGAARLNMALTKRLQKQRESGVPIDPYDLAQTEKYIRLTDPVFRGGITKSMQEQQAHVEMIITMEDNRRLADMVGEEAKRVWMARGTRFLETGPAAVHGSPLTEIELAKQKAGEGSFR